MLYSIGIDLVEIAKVKELVARHPSRLNSIFTSRELSFCGAKGFNKFSMVFAAKEAALKALHTGWEKGRDLLDIEIIPLARGQFKASLSNRLKERAAVLSVRELKGSFSFSGGLVIAQVLALTGTVI